MYLIKENLYNFQMDDYLVFLKGLSYCTKETKSLAVSQIGKDDDDIIQKLKIFLINFEGFFYKLANPIMHNVEI